MVRLAYTRVNTEQQLYSITQQIISDVPIATGTGSVAFDDVLSPRSLHPIDAGEGHSTRGAAASVGLPGDGLLCVFRISGQGDALGRTGME